mgnify:CR=1 FL=1
MNVKGLPVGVSEGISQTALTFCNANFCASKKKGMDQHGSFEEKGFVVYGRG